MTTEVIAAVVRVNSFIFLIVNCFGYSRRRLSMGRGSVALGTGPGTVAAAEPGTDAEPGPLLARSVIARLATAGLGLVLAGLVLVVTAGTGLVTAARRFRTQSHWKAAVKEENKQYEDESWLHCHRL